MTKTDPFSLTAGIILTLGGIALLITSIFVPFLIIYAIITLALGIVILATLKQQEYIEPIKTKRNKKDPHQ